MQLLRPLARAAACLAACALLVTAAHAQTTPPAAGEKPAPVASAVPGVDPLTYKVGPEDVLEVSVWKEEGLKKELLVRPDGGASYPLIGEVQASGKTILELREEIGKRLEKFIPDPVVSVAILKVGSHRVYVIGKVQKPGDFPVGRYIDVLQALSMAGGLTPFADANAIRVMRRDGDKQVIIPFEYNRVVRGDKLEQNIQLRAGDVVVVP
jgi:polysaccharide export outer membrane protein